MRKLIALFALLLLSLPAANAGDTGIFLRPDPATISAPVDGKTVVFDTTKKTFVVYDANAAAYLPIGSGKSNFTATGAPGSGNDNTQGYSIGSIWAQKSGGNGFVWICLNADTGAAYWSEFDQNFVFNAANNALNNSVPYCLNTGDLFTDWIVYGFGIGVTPLSYTQNIQNGIAYINSFRVLYGGETYTYPAFSDVYDYLQPTGDFIHANVSNGDTPPDNPGGQLIQTVITDGSGVVSCTVNMPDLPVMKVGPAAFDGDAVNLGQVNSLIATGTNILASIPNNTFIGNVTGSTGAASASSIPAAALAFIPKVYSVPLTASSFPYTVATDQAVIIVDLTAIGASEVLNLPDLTHACDVVIRFNPGAGNTLTVTPQAGQLVDGNSTVVLSTAGTYRFVSDTAGNAYQL